MCDCVHISVLRKKKYINRRKCITKLLTRVEILNCNLTHSCFSRKANVNTYESICNACVGRSSTPGDEDVTIREGLQCVKWKIDLRKKPIAPIRRHLHLKHLILRVYTSTRMGNHYLGVKYNTISPFLS